MQKNHTIQPLTITGTLFAVLVLGIALIAPTIVHAQQAPPDTAPGATLDQRIQQRKAERGVKLTEPDQKRLVTTCANAQSKVRAMQQSTAQTLTKRSEVYLQIDGRLLVMIGKLKLGQKDTFEFEKQRADLVQKTAQFNAIGVNYKQTLDDLVVINCKVDPVGFKSMLETARAYNVQLKAQSALVNKTIVDTIKPTLSGLASDKL